MDALTVINHLKVGSPCPVAWDSMTGDDRTRHCGSCAKHVYNLSGLTAEEAVGLIRATEGRACVRLYRRGDGTILTGDCPVGLRYVLRRKLVAMATAAVVAFVALRAMVWFQAVREDPDLPPPPKGPGVTWNDWADWSSMAVGLKNPPDATPRLAPQVITGDAY